MWQGSRSWRNSLNTPCADAPAVDVDRASTCQKFKGQILPRGACLAWGSAPQGEAARSRESYHPSKPGDGGNNACLLYVVRVTAILTGQRVHWKGRETDLLFPLQTVPFDEGQARIDVCPEFPSQRWFPVCRSSGEQAKNRHAVCCSHEHFSICNRGRHKLAIGKMVADSRRLVAVV